MVRCITDTWRHAQIVREVFSGRTNYAQIIGEEIIHLERKLSWVDFWAICSHGTLYYRHLEACTNCKGGIFGTHKLCTNYWRRNYSSRAKIELGRFLGHL